MAVATRSDVVLEGLDVSAYEIPTGEPESDGTLEWDSTTVVVVEARAGDELGLGFTYADVSAAAFVESKLAPLVEGRDARAVRSAWAELQEQIRNAGRVGVGA